MILVRGGVIGKDVSMNYKMGEPFGECSPQNDACFMHDESMEL